MHDPMGPLPFQLTELPMPEIVDRFSIGFDAQGVKALEKIKAVTHLKSSGDVGRAGLNVLFDLLTAEERGFQCFFRNADGEEWLYSPHRPADATLVSPGTGKPGNVIRPPADHFRSRPRTAGKGRASPVARA